jgi:hypothetical protein
LALAEPKYISGGDNMEIVEIYEKVNLVIPIEQRRFFNYLEDSVNELQSTYGDFIFIEDKETEYTPPKSLTDEFVVLPLYHNAIVDNILFLANAGEHYKSEFIRKAKDAYLKYWNDNAKGRRIRRMRW